MILFNCLNIQILIKYSDLDLSENEFFIFNNNYINFQS
jgi:hypothetical protein